MSLRLPGGKELSIHQSKRRREEKGAMRQEDDV
jgi:hypothetical protein